MNKTKQFLEEWINNSSNQNPVKSWLGEWIKNESKKPL